MYSVIIANYRGCGSRIGPIGVYFWSKAQILDLSWIQKQGVGMVVDEKTNSGSGDGLPICMDGSGNAMRIFLLTNFWIVEVVLVRTSISFIPERAIGSLKNECFSNNSSRTSLAI